MRKLLNNPWFVAVMAVLALALVAHTVFPGGVRFGLPGFSPADVSAATDGPADVSAQATAWSVVNKIATPVATRDPFAVPVKAEAVTAEKTAEPDLIDSVHLSALWTQDGHTLVVINDHIWQDGDEIGRLKIESATEEGVWLSHWRGRNFISVGGNFTLSTPADKFRRAASSL